MLDKPITRSLISDLIPLEVFHSNDVKIINNGLIELYLILTIAEDALCAFSNNRYRDFDALIGNNSCYLVSYVIFLIACRFKSNLRKEIGSPLKKIKEIKEKLLRITDSFRKDVISISLSKVLLNNEIDLNIDPDFIYIIMAYACTRAKQKNTFEFEEINYDNLIKLYETKISARIPKKTTIRFIRLWQKNLSSLSVRVIQHQSRSIHSDEFWSKYLSDPYILVDQRKRLCAPSLYSAATIYSHLTQIEGAILGLQVNLIELPKKWISRFTLYYQVQEDRTLKLTDQKDIDSHEPIYMFLGCRYLRSESDPYMIHEEFKEKDLKTIVLAHETTYPQYPKSLKAQNIHPDEAKLVEKINHYKKLKGFSLEDPSDLCLAHIFVDDILTQSLSNYDPPVYLPSLSQV